MYFILIQQPQRSRPQTADRADVIPPRHGPPTAKSATDFSALQAFGFLSLAL